MGSGSSRALRFVAAGAVAVLAATSVGAGTASAAVYAGTPKCLVPTLGSDTIPLATVQKDPHTFTSAQVASMEKNFQAALSARGVDLGSLDDVDPIDIPIYVHVIRKNLKVKGGNIPDQWIQDFMTYLNDSYHGTGHSEAGTETPFTFVLSGIDRTTNKRWFRHSASPDYDPQSRELQMKTQLREIGSTGATLNLYIANIVRSGLYGYAKFPADYDGSPTSMTLDGVVIDSETLPGGSEAPFNLGAIGPHEIGHWMGLYHVFQGGCGGVGDEVADTPDQAAPSEGCPEGADTCASDGLDPIHNYMDYSDDGCQDQYTVGQSDRMVEQWFAYRDGSG